MPYKHSWINQRRKKYPEKIPSKTQSDTQEKHWTVPSKRLKTKQDQTQPNCPARIQHDFLFEQGLKDLASQSRYAIICKYTTAFNSKHNCSKAEMD